MPNTKSAAKELRKTGKRTVQNRLKKQHIKTTIKTAKRATDAEARQKAANEAKKLIDKAAKRNIMHKNKAARLKSRLYRALKKQAQTA